MRMLTYKQAAEYLGLKKGTLYSMVHRGRIPHLRLGRRLVRFRKEELDAWLDEHAEGPGVGGASPASGDSDRAIGCV